MDEGYLYPAERFEPFMAEGIQAHAAGNYREALTARLNAYNSEPPRPVDPGRAARDIAASFDRLGDDDLGDECEVSNSVLAAAYAEYAYHSHDELGKEGARELTVSAMYVGVSAARQALLLRRPTTMEQLLAREQSWQEALDYMNEAMDVSLRLRAANQGKFHQYDVNLFGRVAAVHALRGSRERYAQARDYVLELASLSETEAVLGRNANMNEVEVRAAQRKARIRARAAQAVGGLIFNPVLARIPTIGRAVAERLTDRVVL